MWIMNIYIPMYVTCMLPVFCFGIFSISTSMHYIGIQSIFLAKYNLIRCMMWENKEILIITYTCFQIKHPMVYSTHGTIQAVRKYKAPENSYFSVYDVRTAAPRPRPGSSTLRLRVAACWRAWKNQKHVAPCFS